MFERKRVHVFVAASGNELLGYAFYFYTYSSFLARPTLYLEDIFVSEKSRRNGIGEALFMSCVREAVRQGCGRMEWQVLTWNRTAIRFYRKLRAKRTDDWHSFRLDRETMQRLSERRQKRVTS
jgi:GNAT superfamily N-acetyltransferase